MLGWKRKRDKDSGQGTHTPVGQRIDSGRQTGERDSTRHPASASVVQIGNEVLHIRSVCRASWRTHQRLSSADLSKQRCLAASLGRTACSGPPPAPPPASAACCSHRTACRYPVAAHQRKGAGMAGLLGMKVTLREKMAGAGELGTPRAAPGTACARDPLAIGWERAARPAGGRGSGGLCRIG
jgi:hypothetical protein